MIDDRQQELVVGVLSSIAKKEKTMLPIIDTHQHPGTWTNSAALDGRLAPQP
jgi:hypothetical protein